ncbi:uncharacterized protein [Miscanthus floridulus]|uniref:uncharacterized protein n=1 Tax=Miscanthus floridulus TaxID=154761 RepID=UPI003459DB72
MDHRQWWMNLCCRHRAMVQGGPPSGSSAGRWLHGIGHSRRTSASSSGSFRQSATWRPYLWGRRFAVKTDHYSLKYLLDQRLATIPQHHWVGKLLGFDFSVDYKPGAANAVADALSRRDTEDIELLAISGPRFDFFERLRLAQREDPAYVALHEEVASGPAPAHGRSSTECCSTTAGSKSRLGRRCSRSSARVRGKSVILTVVDRFSKYCHFIPLAHPYSAESVAQAFFAEVVRLHGVPQSMVSDRDTVFTSSFWQELMTLTGTKLHMSSAFHPQTDGQSESANRVIIMYLRCLTGDRPKQWLRWLPWAEFLFNTAYQTSLRDTPFRVVYGRDPPSIRSYEPGETRVPAVAKNMAERAEFLADIRCRLEQAQAMQKRHYDKTHRQVSYAVGDWALLRLHHRAASSLPQASTGKLKPRYFGPYRVVELINEVAVRLDLPAGARIHNVFHVGVLKKFQGPPPDAVPPLPPLRHGAIDPEPERAVRYRFANGVPQVLVQWKGASAASATWEDTAAFRAKYPSFQLEDELTLGGEGDVMFGRTYTRRRRARDVRRAQERAAERANGAQAEQDAVTTSG